MWWTSQKLNQSTANNNSDILKAHYFLGDCESRNCYSNQINRRFSDNLHEIMALCLQRDSFSRPSAAQLLTHPFLKIIRRGLSLPELLKPAIPLSDRVAQNPGKGKILFATLVIFSICIVALNLFYFRCLISKLYLRINTLFVKLPTFF